MSQPPTPLGSPGQSLPQPQPQPWPQQGMQPPADRGVGPDGPATDAPPGTPPPSDPGSIAGWTPPPWTAGPDAPAGWPLYAADARPSDTRPFWRRIPADWLIVGALVLIGIGIALGATVDDDYGSPEPVSSYSTGPTTTVDDLAFGECFDDGNAEDEVVRQPCTVAHDGEMIGDVTLPEGPYPGDNGVDKAADRACTADFTNYVGKPFDDSELDLYYWTPTESHWNDDDRLVVCAAYGPSHDKLTGTIKNSDR